jgi:hypothetical protein
MGCGGGEFAHFPLMLQRGASSPRRVAATKAQLGPGDHAVPDRAHGRFGEWEIWVSS